MKTNLDDRLKSWTSSHAPSDEHLLALTQRITHEARQVRHEAHQAELSAISGWGKLAYAGLGAALTCLVFVLAGSLLLSRTAREGSQLTTLAGISSEQLAAQGRLFREMNRMFTEGLRWVAQSDGEVGIGLDTESGLAGREAAPLLVRVTVLARADGATDWHQAWSADMMVRDQDVVEVAPDPRSHNKLTVWVYALEDGKLAVDTRVALNLPVTLESRLNTVVARGLPTEIASTRVGGAEYRIFQTVDVVKPTRS